MGSRNICTICQEVFLFQVEDKDEQPYALKCGHVFHNKCLTQWKANVNKCPQCRATAQNPIRLFFISDSDTNREELDVYMLQAELEKEKSSCHSLKKKNEELRHASESNKEKISKLQLLNDELEHFIPSLKDCINSLRKENKNLSLSIANLENEVKENRMKLQSFSNIRDILDESVDSIEIEKYKNMKPDMIANIVNQWKRNAQYYKQKEMSDRSKYTQLQGDLKKYKEEAVLSKSELLRAKQEVKILRSAVEKQKVGSSSGLDVKHNDLFLDSDEDVFESSAGDLKRPANVSFVNVSPLVKKMKITNVLALNKRPALSTVNPEDVSSHKRQLLSMVVPKSSSVSGNKLPTVGTKSFTSMNTAKSSHSSTVSKSIMNSKSLPSNNSKTSTLFKKTHSFKSSRDIISHFDK